MIKLSILTDELTSEGVSLHFDENHIPNDIKKSNFQSVLIVYTPAVSKDSLQLQFFTSKMECTKTSRGTRINYRKRLYNSCCRNPW